jgi:formate C-acetyltransferase
MSMNERVSKLRTQSLEAVETFSSERAELLTEFYKQDIGLVSTPVFRALAFKYLLEHKAICFQEGELIVGEKGPSLKNAPTFPELCCHSLEDLDLLDQREKTSFKVSPETRARYEETVIPFWKGKSMRELIFNEMTEEWKAAYHAGIFTEFMEQRAPGHTVLDDKIYHKGMLDFQAEIEEKLANLDYLDDPQAYEKQDELRGMHIARRQSYDMPSGMQRKPSSWQQRNRTSSVRLSF